MKILVYGAGVLGSLYAARLHEAGFEVSLLARGQRLEELRQNGLVIEDAHTGERTVSRPHIIEHLEPEALYDWVLVVTRKNQVTQILPGLAANRSPNVLFLVNNAAGPDEMIDALGRERVLLGFPGAGGERVQGVVRYHLASPAQPTTIGELNGEITPRLEQIATALRAAGLPVTFSQNMDAWLKTHVALVSPIANALYLAGGDNYRLARSRDGIVAMVRAVREGLRVLKALGIPVTPAFYQVLSLLPEPVLVWILQRRLPSPQVELVMARHANAARDEMQQLYEEFTQLTRKSGVATPHIDYLGQSLNPAAAQLTDGSQRVALDWSGFWPLLAGGLFLFSMILARQRALHKRQ